MSGDVEGEFQSCPDDEFIEGGTQVVLHDLFGSADQPGNLTIAESLLHADVELPGNFLVARALCQ